MRQRSLVNLVAAVVIAGAVGTSTPAQAQRFCNGFGFGNGGYAAGYSMAVGRKSVSPSDMTGNSSGKPPAS